MPVIKQPIFVIGTGRCGSTIVFEALAQHERLGWFSNYNDWFPRSELASWMPRIFDLPLLRRLPKGEKRQHQQGRAVLNTLLPNPSECYPKWEAMCGRKFRDEYLVCLQATDEERRTVRRAVSRLLQLQRKERFAAKITGPPRMYFLGSIFPDACFVHVIRDARAVVNSLLKVGFWKRSGARSRPKWNNGLPEGWESEWESYGATPAALAAIQYRTIVELARSESRAIGPEKYLEVTYEEFVSDPKVLMQRIEAFAGLPYSDRVAMYVGKQGKYSDMNRSGFDALSTADIEAVEKVVANSS
jgi:hypothetical protein